MYNHDPAYDPERLASFADVLAGELPGAWSSTYHPPRHKDELADLADRIWDLDLVAESLAEHPLLHASVLTRDDGAQLVVLDRHDAQDGFLIAAVAPRLPAEAFRGLHEPNGIALDPDPFLGAETVSLDLLARYDASLAQARVNAQDQATDSTPAPSERLVLAWQADGGLAATTSSPTIATVLQANGFTKDEKNRSFRLGGGDPSALSRAVDKTSRQLSTLGISTAVQHAAARTVRPGTSPAPAAPAPAAPARTR
ncbi:hypothetical protein ACIO3O_08460 [Streptomyces sp. NPDC087440]|uniref:hypothetical protein n=1 Tax=Streptomyces sp. NPDC087440 TaxID=3365790 RepID=UPI00382FCAA0